MKYKVNGDVLTEIANAIRKKNGSDKRFRVSEIANLIDSIEGGGGGVIEGELFLTADGEEFLTVDNEQFATEFQDRLVDVDNFPTPPNEEAVYKIVRSETDVQYGIPINEAEVFRYTEEAYATIYVQLVSQVLDFITYFGMIGNSYLGYKTVDNAAEIDKTDRGYVYIDTSTNTMHVYLSGEWQSNSFTVVENKDSIPSTIGFYGCYGTTRKWTSVDSEVANLNTRLSEKEDEITSLNTQIEESTAKTNFMDYATLEIVDGEISLSSISDTEITSFVIHPSVKVIGGDAFRDCEKLTSVVIPDSVTKISNFAFYGCDSLTSVVIPDSVTLIGNYAFQTCHGLTSVEIGNSVTSICNYAFNNCSSLTSVVIPDSVTTIGSDAFSFCPSLTNVEIGDSVEMIGNDAFHGCYSLTGVEIGDSVTTIGNNAFNSCSLTSIEIPDSVTSIGYYAFANCSSLTSVVIGDSVTSIGQYAFENCSELTSITIPDSVTSIAQNAFSGCDGLQCNGYDNGLYLGNTNNPYLVLVKAKDKSITSCKIPEQCTIICSNFYGCNSLTSIEIPDSVVYIASGSFRGCESLTSIVYTGTMEQWRAIKKIAGWNTNTGEYTIHCTDGDIAKS